MKRILVSLGAMLSLGLAVLHAQPYTLTVNVAHGVLTRNPDLLVYAAGDTVQLTVVPSSGYYFVNWSGDTNATNNPITVTMYKNITITANFGTAVASNGTGGGSWNSASTWAGGILPTAVDSVIIAGTDAVTIPNVVPDTCGRLVIQSGGTLTVDTNFVVKNGTMTVYGTVIDTLGGTITVASAITYGNGSLYRHARAGGSLPLATWGTGSTCMVTGTTSASPGNGNQNFYNFVWNCPGQTTGLNLAWDNITIGGDLTCTASGASAAYQFRMTSAATARNITIKGNIIVNGGYLTASGSSGAAQYNINVLGNISVQSGKFGLCQGSGGFGTWKLCGDLTISGGQFVVPSNTTVNTRLIFAKKNGTQYYTLTSGTNANLHYGVDSGATVILNSPLTVGNATTGYLVLTQGKFVTTSTNIITMTVAAVDSLYGNNLGYVDGPVIVTVASTASTAKRFPIGKGSIFRPVTLTVTQDAATSTTYMGEMFNAAPATRILPSTLDAVSSVHYYTITKGTGANVTNATIQLTYGGGDDSVSNKTQIRIAKDDGAGNWINLGGSGTADSVGTILSNIFGSATSLGTLTTNDFVIAHVNPVSIPVLATLTTNAITDISTTFATSGGSISNDGNAAITAKGVCWNTTGSPTTIDSITNDGTTSTPFTSTLTGLIAGMTYHVRAYAINSAGTAYGNEISFTTLTTLVAPTVTTDSIRNIVNTDAKGYGTVTAWGGSAVTERGICWSTSHSPTTADDHNSSGTGSGTFTAPIGGLMLGTTYYVRAYATNSTGTSYGSELSFATPAPQPDVFKIVDKNGTVGVTCDYTTVQAAFDAVPTSYTGHWFIFVRKGIYYEKDQLAPGKINVVLVGQDRDSTILTYDDYAGKSSSSSGTSTSYSVAIFVSDFQAQSITFRNTATTAQAVALETNGDRQVYYNCKMVGYQDTYYTQGGLSGPDRIYNKKCYIEGSVDFIFGRDVAVFDSCVLYCNRNGGTLTAAATEAGFQFGYVFLNDSISSLPAGAIGFDGNPMSSFYLGRPWQAAPKTVFLYCYEPATLNTAGWTTMGPSPALYSEYNCTGPGAVASRPVITAWTTSQPSTITAGQAADYTVTKIFSKSTAAAPFAYSANWMPVILNVTFPSSVFSAAPSSVDFGTTGISVPRVDSITVTNTGNAALSITGVQSMDSRFAVTPTTATIAVSGTKKFYITFTPDTAKFYSTKLLFTSNTTNGTDTVTLHGFAYSKLRDVRTIITAAGTGTASVYVQGVITRAMGSFVRIQDSTAGLTVNILSGSFRDSVASNYLKGGDVLFLNGTGSNSSNLQEVSALATWMKVGIDSIPAPVVLTLAQLKANPEYYESMLIKVNNLSISGASGAFNENVSYPIVDPSDTSKAISLYMHTGESAIIGTTIPAVFTCIGVVTQNNATYQLTPVLTTDIVVGPVSVKEPGSDIPKIYSLQDNYPNPFNPSTTIRYGLPKQSRVTMKVYSILGQEIATLVNGVQDAGYHQVSWNASRNASGVYLLRIVAQSVDSKSQQTFTQVKKMLMMK